MLYYINYFGLRDGMRRIIGLILLMYAGQAFAHPHSFIAMDLTLTAEEQTITGIKMVWTMDAMTSADLLYDAENASDDSEAWKKLAAEVMANVLTQDYFTEIYRGNERVDVPARPSEYHLAREGHRAILTFTLPFMKPQPVSGEPLAISTFDPSYFVDFSYDDERALHLPAGLKASCQLALFTPAPDRSLQAYALSLDKADSPDEDLDLGKQFAQKVTLQCH